MHNDVDSNGPPADLYQRNDEVDWEKFPVEPYKEVNYSTLEEDDRQIITLMRDFFAGAGTTGERGLDVGCGPNLYPSMAQLPFCRNLALIDRCHNNLNWMSAQIQHPDASWDEFWAVLQANPAYCSIGDFRTLLKAKAKMEHGNVFTLERRTYDIGTMFFVAESMTSDIDEFRLAVLGFVGSLRKGAPFAMAFMTGSACYPVDGEWFPGVSIGKEDVRKCLAGEADGVEFIDIGMRSPKLREGYEGMLLATGWSAGE